MRIRNSDVVDDLRARGAGRITVVGFSNGGMMAYRLACERPDVVDTIGVMSGTLEIPHCDGHITALHLHGSEDTAVPFTGERYSTRLRCFLRDVRTIPGAAPGSTITIRTIPERFESMPDPMIDVFGKGVDVASAIAAIERRMKPGSGAGKRGRK